MKDEVKIGQLLTANEQKDAIHIAVAPVTANEEIMPGDEIGFIDSAAGLVGDCDKPIGIADPFLKRAIKKGERFYLFLFPNTVTGMRHEWQHPAFTTAMQASDKAADARRWIEQLAENIGDPFDTFDLLMAHVQNCIDGGSHFTEHGHESMRSIWYENEEQFWKHFETLTGNKKPHKYMSVFCCSC
jgi:hypothetical protein